MDPGHIGFFKAVGKNINGSFLEMDDGKDLFMPLNEQRGEVNIGEEYLVIVFKYENTPTLLLSQKIDKHLKTEIEEGELTKNQEVSGYVYELNPLGAKVAINKTHKGLIFKNEINQELKVGDQFAFFIKTIREDGKIDLALKKQGYRGYISSSTEQILKELQNANGVLPYNDKSTPEEINKVFKMSKKVFKESIGKLYKQRLIGISDKGIRLVTE
ncbi:MAG: GntR family transcriptional regulator [Candidatus Dojkabacteria bacterium]